MSRWTPERAGILNVWRYFDEVFTFHKGRLLLRGPNGSGKSKVLELLLPYLLDASLKASRLSTFGGSERTMHWNLMGDGASGTTRVGYVWLEFVHPDGHWFTCGARLAATAHTTSVTPHYFTTTRRIGYGLALADEAGQPLTRAQLEAELGDEGTVHATADDYRTHVRQTLYRGLNETRYDSLLTALRQLRTPKLSERLDPGLLSELLSSALPPLGDGEIREIAEGFERLDRQREELGKLEEDVQAVARLLSRQQTYARRVVRAAAHAVTSATSAMEKAAADMKDLREELAGDERALTGHEEALTVAEADRAKIAARIDGLKEKDAYKAGAELDRLRRDAYEAAKTADDREREKARTEREAARKAEAAVTAKENLAAAERQTTGVRSDAERLADAADLPFERFAEPDDPAESRGLLRAVLGARRDALTEMRTLIGRHQAATERRETAEKDREDARIALAAARGAAQEAGKDRGRVASDLFEAYMAWPGRCSQLRLDGADLIQAVEPLDSDAFSRLDLLLDAARTEASERLVSRKTEAEHQRRLLKAERDRHAAERAEMHGRKQIVPPKDRTRPADRTGRPGIALWRALSFRDDAPDQAAVEAALEAAGLLDLWVLPDGHFAEGEWDAFAAPGNAVTGPSLADVLVPEPDAPPAVVRLLRSVAVASTASAVDHSVVIGFDGSWRLGPATGRWGKDRASYLGAAAQERARRDRITELDTLIGALDERIADCDETLVSVQADRASLDAEWAARPSREPFLEAARVLDRALASVALREDGVQEAEIKVRDREKEAAAAFRKVELGGTRTGLPTTPVALDVLELTTGKAEIAVGAWLDARGRLEVARGRWDDAESTSETYREIAGTAAETALAARAKADALEERRAAVEPALDASHREVLQEIAALEARHHELVTEIKKRSGAVTELKIKLGIARNGLGDLDLRHGEAIESRDLASARFRRLAEGHLFADTGVELSPLAEATVRRVLDAARLVGERLARTAHEQKNIRDAEAGLRETYHQVRDVLQGRAELELTPDDDVQVLTATVGGVRLGLTAFAATLRTEQDERATDITDSEHELFDRTLAGDTRRHLADRIRQANQLVEGMNARLQRVRTASRVAVQLVWQVDAGKPSGTRAARDLLLREPKDLTEKDRDALHRFFRGLLDEAKADDTARGWEEQLFKVLDYTTWHQFVVRLDRADGKGWQDLTRRLHGALSGGEKAIALHLPLFAAVAAHYQTDPGCPRFILLDEVFVGVDRANRGQVFELLVDLGLDLVLTSDHEWCDYRELDGIAIHALQTGDGDDAVTTARFVWNGFRTVEA